VPRAADKGYRSAYGRDSGGNFEEYPNLRPSYAPRAGAKTVITALATRVKILEPKEGEVRVGIGDALDLNL